MKSCINRIDPAKLAVVSALLMLIGDFLAFIGAIIAVQEQDNEQAAKKDELNQQIGSLQKQLEDIRRKL